MNRVAWFIICTLVGLELIGWGLLVPSHIRARDARVLELTGSDSPSLASEGLALVKAELTGPATMLLKAAERLSLPGRDKLAAELHQAEADQPRLKIWGGPALYVETIFGKRPPTTNRTSQPLIEVLLTQEARATVIEALRATPRPGVLEILNTRTMTNTVVFPPALSPSGQPLDATITMTALLLQQDQFAKPLRNSIERMVSAANQGGDARSLERVYLELLALGKRLDWGQLVHLLKRIPDTLSLQEAAFLLREREGDLPIIYSAIHLADSANTVSRYLDTYPATGMKDLSFAMKAGSGAARELLRWQQSVHYPTVRQKMTRFWPIRAAYQPMARIALNNPPFAFVLKYGLALIGTLLIARAVMYLSPSFSEEIVAMRPFVSGPQVAIALCLLFGILFFTESLVTRAAPVPKSPLRLKIPVASAALHVKIPHQSRAMIDKFSAISLLTFFVMQAVIYVICRMKLAEIRRQTLPSKLKLRLLENEEHLFDAGLYFGFVGTVASLVLVSIGIIKPSLMAAYSSTSFGIIFVSVLKIFNVRPYRRRLILDTEIADRPTQPA